MIWHTPWAWAGLLTLAVPVLIHLLSRRDARVQRFPTLRFLDPSRLNPTRRTRLNDLPLLAVRLGILAAAVAALAQPLVLTADRKREIGEAVARAIVIDTSASMRRATPAGEPAIEAARRDARQLAATARTSVVLETAAPARALAGAADWLGVQTGQRELVVLSDFQLGTIEQADLSVVPADIGVRLTRIDVQPAAGPIVARTLGGGAAAVARITLARDETDVSWSLEPAGSQAGANEPLLLAGPTELADAAAAERAATEIAWRPPVPPDRPMAIVYPQYADRRTLMRDARMVDRPWMADVAARVRRDSTLVAAASVAEVETAELDSTRFLVVARTEAGRPVAVAAHAGVQGTDRLLLISMAEPGSLASAALIAAALRAVSPAPPAGELEPAVLSDTVLRGWQRTAAAVAPRGGDAPDRSDGRWLWLLALALLAVETWMRRRSRVSPDAPAAQDPAHAHV